MRFIFSSKKGCSSLMAFPDLPRTAIYTAVLCGFMAGSASSQDVPLPGQILQEIERSQRIPLLPEVGPVVRIPAERPEPNADGVRFEFKGARFTGNTLLTDEQLQEVVSEFVGNQLSIDDLYLLAGLITDRFFEAGFLVTTRLPEQEVTDGVVAYEVVEARFGGAAIDPESLESVRINPEQIERLVESANPKGAPVNLRNIERGRLLVGDLAGIQVVDGLRPGEDEGETVLGMTLSATPLFSGTAGLDNQGGRSTGSERIFTNMQWANPRGQGDLLSATALKTEGTEYVRVSYRVPVGSSGWQVEGLLSHVQYDIVIPEFASTKPRGNSQVATLEGRYPWVRGLRENHYVAVGTTERRFENEQMVRGLYEPQSDYKVNVTHVTLSGNRFEGGNTLTYELEAALGRVNLQGSPNYEEDLDGAKTHGRYGVLNAQVSYVYPFAPAWTLRLNARGQAASQNLDSSEKFYLGGAGGVRAYPESEGGGSDGVLVNLDVDRVLSGYFLGTVFLDWGRVRQYKFNENVNGNALADVNLYNLKGYGVSVTAFGPWDSQVKATWAKRIGSNPNPTSEGNDQSGDLQKDRFWLSMNIPF